MVELPFATVDYDLRGVMAVAEDGPIRIVTFNRPDAHNAVNADMHWAIANVWRQLRTDRDARVVVLTGAGDSFCAGGDVDWMPALQDEELREEIMNETTDIFYEMIRFPLPVIAAVNGAAITLGCNLAVMSDVVLMADTAFLADPHVSAGVVPGDGGAAMWPLLANVLRVREFLFTGDPISAELAVEIGLATRVVPHAELMDEALRLAKRLARQPRFALQDTKKTINLHLNRALTGAIHAASAAERVSLASAGHRERLEKLRARAVVQRPEADDR